MNSLLQYISRFCVVMNSNSFYMSSPISLSDLAYRKPVLLFNYFSYIDDFSRKDLLDWIRVARYFTRRNNYCLLIGSNIYDSQIKSIELISTLSIFVINQPLIHRFCLKSSLFSIIIIILT